MRKMVLTVVALCCMMSAGAQSNIALKLDSLFYNNGSTIVQFNYNPHYDYSSVVTLFYGTLLSTMTYEYDAQNRLIRATNIEPGSDYKIEYAYNEQGWVSEEIHYDRVTQWTPSVKTLYEYDNNGNILKATDQLYIEEEFLVNNYLSEYRYVNGKLAEMVKSYWEAAQNAWALFTKDEYTYDSEGNCTEIQSSFMSTNNWTCHKRVINEYDEQRNCVKQSKYEIGSGTNELDLSAVIECTYDLSVAADIIAGLGEFVQANELSVHNKLLKVEETSYGSYGTHLTTCELCYSSCAGVGELPTHPLKVWPNPADEVLNLSADDLRQVEIFGMDGKQVMRFQDGFETLNVSGLAKGNYLLKVTMKDGQVATQKFVKE